MGDVITAQVSGTGTVLVHPDGDYMHWHLHSRGSEGIMYCRHGGFVLNGAHPGDAHISVWPGIVHMDQYRSLKLEQPPPFHH